MRIEKQIRNYYRGLEIPAAEKVLPACAFAPQKKIVAPSYGKMAVLVGAVCVLLLVSVLLLPGMRTPDDPHISVLPTVPTKGTPTDPTVNPTNPTQPTYPAPLEPTEPTEPSQPVLYECPVEWSDFLQINGVYYRGDWRQTEISADRIGQKIGEVSCRIIKGYSYGSGKTDDFFYGDDKGIIYPYNQLPNGTSALNMVGTELFAVKDNENAIAALVNGKYYLYLIA